MQVCGGYMVVIDLCYIEMVEVVDSYYFIKLGVDVFFLMGILNVLFVENFFYIVYIVLYLMDFDKIEFFI